MIIASSLVTAKKKRGNKRPNNIDSKLYCSSCNHVLQIAMNKLYYKKTSEMDVFDALSNICILDNFINSDFAPNEMLDGCESFIGNFEQKLETFLMKR